MSSVVLYFLPFLVQILFCNALPPVAKCKLSDSECLKSSAIAVVPILLPGIPEINSEPIDPMHISVINVDLSGLNLVMKDVVITGLKEAKIDKVSIDMAKKEMKLKFGADFLLKSKYKASGQLLILPISGDGDATLKITNLEIELLIHFDVIKNSQGKDVIGLKSYTYNYDIKDGLKIRLTNLFNGNTLLSDTLHKFMDDNWKQLTEEFGRPLLDPSTKVVFKVVKKYLKSQALEDVTLE